MRTKRSSWPAKTTLRSNERTDCGRWKIARCGGKCGRACWCDPQHQHALTLAAALAQVELATLEHKLAETREYNRVLEFMEKRLQKQKITFTGTLQAYEESLRLRKEELNDSMRCLHEVKKEKQSEEQQLMRYQVRVALTLHAPQRECRVRRWLT